MNICFLIVKITESPKRLFTANQLFTELTICFPNIKKGLCYAQAIAKGKVGNDLFNLHVKGDYIIIECKILKKTTALKQNMEILINAYHNAHIIYQVK